MNLKRTIKSLIPPMLWQLARNVSGQDIQWKGDFETFEAASNLATGYDDTQILSRVINATQKVISGEALCERDSVTFDTRQTPWAMLSSLLHTTLSEGGHLHVVDFGGSLGSSYWNLRPWLKCTREIRWAVVEQSHFVDAGKQFENDEIRFFHTIDKALDWLKPHCIMYSSVLQYLPEPSQFYQKEILGLFKALIVDRTPMSQSSKHRICLQTVPSSIYPSSYPCHIFAVNSLQQTALNAGFQILDSWKSPWEQNIPQRTFSGFYARKKSD